MAGTGSDQRPVEGTIRPRRFSLRLRLAALYAACFILGSAAVLGIVFVLVGDSAGQLKAFTENLGIKANGTPYAQVRVNGVTVSLTLEPNTFGPRYTAAQLAEIRVNRDAFAACMRGQGLAFPNPVISPGPGGHGFYDNFPTAWTNAHPLSWEKPGYPAAQRLCDARFPPVLDPKPGPYGQVDAFIAKMNASLKVQQNRSMNALLLWSLVAFGVMAMISIALGWLLGGRALRPLARITTSARRITAENLHERLSGSVGEDELGELAGTFDGVLTRLERAFEAQKRFVANASHELRTPVTLERALLEFVLSDPDADAATFRRTCELLLSSTGQQEQMIEALLTLARSQAGTEAETSIDLAVLAQDAITLREHQLSAFTLASDLQPARLAGDSALIERLIANLVDNAMVHNTAGGWVSVETGEEDGAAWLRVLNSGAEIPQEQASELFEPFRRLDGSRTAVTPGVGLGLSIVRAIAELHGGSVEARALEHGGLSINVHF